MYNGNGKTLVIQHGTLIDGSGRPATTNEAMVIEGNRIRSVGRLPEDVRLEDQDQVQVIDATEHWIMPGLIDGHCHLTDAPTAADAGHEEMHDEFVEAHPAS